MSLLNYSCNITSADIKNGEGIVLIPISTEIHTELSECGEGDDNSIQIPFERRFHGIDEMNFEPFAISGIADTYPMIKLNEYNKDILWRFMKSFHKNAVASISDENLTHQLKNKVKSASELYEESNIQNSTHYPWISTMAVALQLCETEGEEAVRNVCEEQIIYYFIDNLYFGIPFMGSTKTTPQLCNMKIASFATSSLNKMKELPVHFGKNSLINFTSFENFNDFVIERYCTENIDIEDPDVLATQLAKNFLGLHKVLFTPIGATFCEDKVPEEMIEIQKALKVSKEPMKTFKKFVYNLCLIEYMQYFNIRPKPMTVIDSYDNNPIRSENYKVLIQSLLS